MHQLVTLPPAIRLVVLPPDGGGSTGFETDHAEPAAFSPIDPSDVDTFLFDWVVRAYPGDPILSAAMISVPTGLTFITPAVAPVYNPLSARLSAYIAAGAGFGLAVSTPPVISPATISGSLVSVTIGPFDPPVPVALPMVYALRCGAAFASGRLSSFSVAISVQTL